MVLSVVRTSGGTCTLLLRGKGEAITPLKGAAGAEWPLADGDLMPGAP